MKSPADQTRGVLTAALTSALKRRDVVHTRVIRGVLAAIANAEAVVVGDGATSRSAATSEHVAGAVVGLGAAEAERRQLTCADIRAILLAERDERTEAALTYRSLGEEPAADDLQAEADVLESLVGALTATAEPAVE